MGELQKTSQTVMDLKVPRKEDGKEDLTVEIIIPLECFHYLILLSSKSSKNPSRWIKKFPSREAKTQRNDVSKVTHPANAGVGIRFHR